MLHPMRFCDPYLNRFLQPDSITPNIYNPQNLNKYSYVNNSPIGNSDPSGHCMVSGHDFDSGSSACQWTHNGQNNGNGNVVDHSDNSGGHHGGHNVQGGSSTNPLDSTTNGYMNGWQNYGTAWSTMQHSGVGSYGWNYSLAYMTAWGGAHVMFGLGGGMLAYSAYAAIAGAAGAVEGANIACGGDECASEVGDVASTIDGWTKIAKDMYPGKANLGIELHHIFPQYMGGDPEGALAPLDAAYHQLITNAFRAAWAQGQGAPSIERALGIMQEVYNLYPLPPLQGPQLPYQ